MLYNWSTSYKTKILEKEKVEPSVLYTNVGGWHSMDNCAGQLEFQEVVDHVQSLGTR